MARRVEIDAGLRQGRRDAGMRVRPRVARECEGGRVIKIAVTVATGVNADGFREILGVATSTAESGAGWNSFFKDLVARGLNASPWSPPTRTPGWSTRSVRTCPARPGSGAAPTTPPT